LIEQLQFTGEESYSTQLRLNFNHPCKELIWVSKWPGSKGEITKNPILNWNNYSDTANESLEDPYVLEGNNPIVQSNIKLNGNDRIAPRDGSYFDKVQPFQHHTNVPRRSGINVYSFAIKPEEHQPSGTLNMSRIDSAVLTLKIDDADKKQGNIQVYSINYNVLRILSGMGGLAYSN